MGQYYKLVNETKKEVVTPDGIEGGSKFLEWLGNNQSLIPLWLLRRSNEGGGGDLADFDSYKTLGKLNKKAFYQDLAKRHNRTSKSFEFRMQNISYVYALLGRPWIAGLLPAKNVGATTVGKIEGLIHR